MRCLFPNRKVSSSKNKNNITTLCGGGGVLSWVGTFVFIAWSESPTLIFSTRVLHIAMHHPPRYLTRQHDGGSSSNNNNRRRRHATAPGRKVARRRTCPWQTERKRTSVERPRATRRRYTYVDGDRRHARVPLRRAKPSYGSDLGRSSGFHGKEKSTCASAAESREFFVRRVVVSHRREIGRRFLKTFFVASSRKRGQTSSAVCRSHFVFSRTRSTQTRNLGGGGRSDTLSPTLQGPYYSK